MPALHRTFFFLATLLPAALAKVRVLRKDDLLSRELNVQQGTSNCQTSYEVEMRDGVTLTTVVTLPDPCDSTYPVVIDRTPYGPASDTARNYVKYGFASIQQDQRGCWTSGGDYDFWKMDGQDAYDTMAWVTNQTWSNQEIYQVGVSADACSLYSDFIVENPYLDAAYATWGTGFGHETCYWGGAYVSGLIKDWLDDLVMCANSREIEKEVEYNEGYDDWWANLEAFGPYGNHFPSDDVPAIHRAGWWDIFQYAQLSVFNGAVSMADPDVRAKQFLFVEPLGHCEGSAGAFGFPNYAISDYFTMSVAIFQNDWSNPVFDRTNTINMYVFGSVPNYLPRGTPPPPGNYWTSLPDWPASTPTTFYLNGKGVLASSPDTSSSQTTYTYDPKNTVPTTGGNNLFQSCGPRDQSKLEARDDVIVWEQTETLTEPLAFCGNITANIFVSSDQVDTDFYVTLTDIYPTGEHVTIRYGAIRMRWREGQTNTTAPPMKAGEVYQVEVNMWATCQIVDAGHKFGVNIASSNSPQFQTNPNNGLLLSESPQPIYVAQNSVHSGQDTPSSVTIPVVSISDLPQNTQIQ